MTERQKNLLTLIVLVMNIYFALASGKMLNAFLAGALSWMLVERILPE